MSIHIQRTKREKMKKTFMLLHTHEATHDLIATLNIYALIRLQLLV